MVKVYISVSVVGFFSRHTVDSRVTMEEYIKYKRKAFKEKTGSSLSVTEVEDERYKFGLLAGETGEAASVTWWVFLNNEALKILRKRPKVNHVS